MGKVKFLIIGLLIFFSPFLVKADTVFDQQQIADDTTKSWGWNNTNSWRAISQSFIPTSSQINGVYLKLSRNAVCPDTGIYGFAVLIKSVENGQSSTSSSDILAYWKGTKEECEALIPLSGTPSLINFPLTQKTNLTIGTTTYIMIGQPGDYGDGERYNVRYQSSNAYANGRLAYTKDDSFSVKYDTGGDLYFQTYYSTLGNYIDILTPASELTYKDFKNFYVEYQTASSSNDYTIVLQYGVGTTTQEFFHTYNANSSVATNTRIFLSKPEIFANGTYNINSILWQGDDLVAYSSTTIFYIDNINGITPPEEEKPKFGMTPQTPEQICAGIDTGTVLGYIDCGFRRVLTWAFLPSSTAVDDFETTVDDLKASFPFNVYFDLTTTINTAVSTTTTSMNDTLGIPMIRNTGTSTEYYILPVISSSSMANAIGVDNSNLFRSTISWIIWILVAVFFIITLRK